MGADSFEYAPPIPPQSLPFPGEAPLIYIEQSEPHISVAIVRSCAPYSEGCANPQLKARSVQGDKHGRYDWKFADLKNCEDAVNQTERLLSKIETSKLPLVLKYRAEQQRVKTAEEHAAENLVTLLSSCLSKSYMTPPWER